MFTRPEPRATFADLVRGLLADVPRKNSWQLAEHVGHGSAYRLEWLLNGAKWDADALRDRVRDYVVASLGAEDGVLIADDAQVIKKGDKSVGVAPQHCGATGRQTENCQVLPMLSYASARGHAFIDRALYLPRRWTDDPQRCAQAGVPAERGFATKPELVRDMLDRALTAGVPFRYFTADSGYGRDPGAARPLPHRRGGLRDGRPDRSAAGRARRRGHPPRPGAGHGAEIGVGAPLLRQWHQRRPLLRLGSGRGHRQIPAPAEGHAHTLLIRRSVSDPSEIEFFLAHAPASTRIPELIAVAGMRWEDRGEQRPGQGPARPRPVPGPQVDPLAPTRDHLHARPRLPRRHPHEPGKTPTPRGLLRLYGGARWPVSCSSPWSVWRPGSVPCWRPLLAGELSCGI